MVIYSGPSPLLIIDSTGAVQTAVNITVNGLSNPEPTNPLSAAAYVEVNDLKNLGTGDIYMRAAGGTITGGNHVPPPGSVDNTWSSASAPRSSSIRTGGGRGSGSRWYRSARRARTGCTSTSVSVAAAQFRSRRAGSVSTRRRPDWPVSVPCSSMSTRQKASITTRSR